MTNNEIFEKQVNLQDADSFRLLYKDYYRALVCYAAQITGEIGASEDIVQELFSTIWEKKVTFQSLHALKAYLYNSARNASLDYLKHKDVENNYLQKSIENHPIYNPGEDNDDDFFGEEIYRQLIQTIQQLPERCKVVFLLHMEGKKNEEIAQALHVSLETVKTQKKRAMSFLRKKLSPSSYLLCSLLFF